MSNLREVSESHKAFMNESTDFIKILCQDNQEDKMRLISEYEQKCSPVIILKRK
jgi:hypothetical protein